MVLSPPVLALLGCSAVVCGLTVMAAAVGMSVAIGWDHLDSGPEQLLRERRWFLVEASLRLILGLQVFSLVLFVVTADHLKSLFTGAMCAVGTLNASQFGFPTLLVKAGVFVLCGLWLVADRATAGAASTGLVRFKVVSLLALAAALAGENLLQVRYFLDLDPDIITSCCATLFDRGAAGIGAGIANISPTLSRAAFFGGLALTIAVGMGVLGSRRSALAYSVLAMALGAISTVAIVTWIAPAYYELPTHHCPLCLLAADHGFIGYPLYLSLAAAVITGVGSGLVSALRAIDPLRCIRPHEERRLNTVSLACFALVTGIALWPVVTSPFRLEVL
ncbi:MAG: hypothetical protein ACYTGF_02860 [Planctomycetota bacterium]